MRPGRSMPRPTRSGGAGLSRRARTGMVIIVIAIFALLLSVRGIANFITDYLWFRAADFGEVWSGVLFAKVALAAVFIALFFAICWVNLWLADRLAGPQVSTTPEDEAVQRFRSIIGSRWGLLRIAVTALFALSLGAGAAGQWRSWLLFRNATDFGEVDPHFGRDIGFYVFRLPFLTWLANWLFTSMVVVLVLALAMHYLSGGIRMQAVGDRVTPQVKAHVSVLLAIMALIRAGGYWLERFALAYSSDGRFAGLSYTDVEARLPVLSLLILIALLSVVLFVVNISRRGWGLPAVAVGLWALVSIVMAGIYPVVVQRFSVNPDETTKEAQYISRNIIATKNAFGLGEVAERTFNYDEALSGPDLQSNADNVASVPLLDPQIAVNTFTLQQVERSFFRFATDRDRSINRAEIDVDRYEIDGVVTPVVIGARGLNPAGLPEQGWESEVLSFTHGNGVALAPANTIEESLPVFLIGDVPIDNSIEDDVPIEQPRIYFGEQMTGYAIVDTARDEVDSIQGSTRLTHNYEGSGGVTAGGFWRRAMFSLRFQSIDPLISDFVADRSRFVWNRDVTERVSKVAPFLELDHNPYPVVLDGRIVFVIDAYTTTTNYPYAQRRDRNGLDSRSGLNGNYNYVRNSVKAVVDAYDGTVELYIVDPGDPIIQAWSKTFPNSLKDFSEMPTGLIDNLRYPEDMFWIQTNMWSKYHITSEETADLLEGSDEWSVSQDPGGVEGARIDSQTQADGTTRSAEARVDPYYTVLRLPEENEQEFVVMRSFVPFSNNDTVKEMQAFMAGVSEVGSERYGRLVSYEIENVDGDSEAPGPALVASQISSQEQISERISLLNAQQEGSSVELGDLVVLPVESSLVYVRPLYVIATQTKQPNLEWVIVSHADNVVMCHGLSDAINALFGVRVNGVQRANDDDAECIGDIASSRSTLSSVNRTRDTGPITVADGTAIEQASDLLDQARDALISGDLGRYQQLVDTAAEVLDEALENN